MSLKIVNSNGRSCPGTANVVLPLFPHQIAATGSLWLPAKVNCNFDLAHRYTTTAKYSKFRLCIAILGAVGELFVLNKWVLLVFV